MITQLAHFNLHNADIELLEREFDCIIKNNPTNGWWQIHATTEDTPTILSWINAFKDNHNGLLQSSNLYAPRF